jgi:hypothetical protein
VRSLVKRRTRIHAGNMQAATHPELRDLPGLRESSGPWWRAVIDEPRLAPAALPYAAINALAKVNARRQLRTASPIAWNRDETTRQAPTPASPAAQGPA